MPHVYAIVSADGAEQAAAEDLVDRIARDAAATPALWQHIPLELAFSAAAILIAAGLKLAGIFP